LHHPAPICLYSGLADAYRGSGIWLKRNVNERDYVGLRPLKYFGRFPPHGLQGATALPVEDTRHRQYLGTVEHLVFVIDDPPCRISKGTVANVSYPLLRGSQELRQWRLAERKH